MRLFSTSCLLPKEINIPAIFTFKFSTKSIANKTVSLKDIEYISQKMEQFGDVFISDGKVDVPLKSACFSNLDWTWYNQVGEVHQDLKTYGEKLVSIGIKIENKNQHGQLEPYHCKIQLPYLLKDLPRGPTKEYFDFAKDSEIATAKELGIFGM